MKKILLTALAALFLCSCSTCNCDLALKEARRILSETKKKEKELLRIEKKVEKMKLECEAASRSAKTFAEQCLNAQRVCINVMSTLKALEK